MAVYENKNNILAKLSVAAKTALAHPRHVELAHFIGAGPSIRARARLALAAAFLVAAPTLFIGVMRTEGVGERAATLSEYNDFWKQILETRLLVKDLDLSLAAYASEKELENGQAAINSSETLKIAIRQLVAESPIGLNISANQYFESIAYRLDGLIKRSVSNFSGVAPARLSLIALEKELIALEKRVVSITMKERKEALGALGTVGRDQLILFLILIFAIPIFVGFVPNWLVSPLLRLKRLILKIESGQLKDLAVSGRDEVASLARAFRSYFNKREELDQKKSSKIFEMRNVLRSVIHRVKEPVLILDSTLRINYTNEAAGTLLGLPSHQMEGTTILDAMYSPLLKKAAEKAFSGDVNEEAIAVKVEISNGRSYDMMAKLGAVRNRDGDVSRIVIVLYPNDQ